MRVINRTFTDDEVVLDFHDFDGCTFTNCTLVFHGYGPVGLDSCTFKDCSWKFDGPAAATVSFMTAIHKQGGGGRELIEATIKTIRGT